MPVRVAISVRDREGCSLPKRFMIDNPFSRVLEKYWSCLPDIVFHWFLF